MDWNEGRRHHGDPRYEEDDFGALFALILLAVALLVAAGIVVFSAGVLHIIDTLAFGNFLSWYWEFGFGGICLPIFCFMMSDYSKNPIVWYMNYKKLDVDYRQLEKDEYDEMKEWIDENVQGHWVANRYYNRYRFVRKSDAMAFKLRWG